MPVPAYLSDLAAAEIESLESKGVRLTAKEVVAINALAHRVQTVHSVMRLARGTPIGVGGVVLWPLTFYGADWYERHSKVVTDARLDLWLAAYAMANQHDELPEVNVVKLVRKWAHKLRCTVEELAEACGQMYAQTETLDTGEQGTPTTSGFLCASLAAMTKTAPEVWERQCAIPYVLEMLTTVMAQNESEGESSRHDPSVRALRALGLYVKRIENLRGL